MEGGGGNETSLLPWPGQPILLAGTEHMPAGLKRRPSAWIASCFPDPKGSRAWEGQQTTSFFSPVSSRDKDGPCFLSRAQNSPVCSLFGFSKHRHMETIWGFGPPHGVWIVRNGVDGKAGIADPATRITCGLTPSNRKHVLPSVVGSPKIVLHRAWSLGGHRPTRWPPLPAPKDAEVGVQQEPESRLAVPRLCSISHCRGWAPSPLHPPSPWLHLCPFWRRYPGSLH